MSDEIIFIKNLIGFSGCEIKLYCAEDNVFFVRKISSSKEYNARLKKQMEKQIYFYENLSFGNINSPKVLDSGWIGELFFFDMEYIRGINLIEHILTASPEELKEIVSTIIKLLERLESTESNNEIEIESKIDLKIKEIKSKINLNLSCYNSIMDGLRELVLKETFCHGDLNFENILYDRESNSYYLIDFLDSFIEHYFFDITKLFQDLEGKWYLLRNPGIDKNLMEIKMYFIKEFLWEKYLKDKNYAQYHAPLLKLNFARILPYARKEHFSDILKIIEAL